MGLRMHFDASASCAALLMQLQCMMQRMLRKTTTRGLRTDRQTLALLDGEAALARVPDDGTADLVQLHDRHDLLHVLTHLCSYRHISQKRQHQQNSQHGRTHVQVRTRSSEWVSI